MKSLKITIFAALLSFSANQSAIAELNAGEEINQCASASVARKVQNFYAETKGAPSPIPARALEIPELYVVTGLPAENRVGILANQTILKDLWSSIDGWGKDAAVHLVFTMGGQHVFDFPSLIPMRQEDLDDGWLDIYADDGAGVHGHLWLDRVRSVHAFDIEGRDEIRTRGISFFLPEGDLAISVYASISTKEADQKAIDGFYRTWKLIEQLPQVCT